MSLLPPFIHPDKKVMFPMGQMGEQAYSAGRDRIPNRSLQMANIHRMSQVALKGTVGSMILLYLWDAPYEQLAQNERELFFMGLQIGFNTHLHTPQRLTSLLPGRGA